MYIVIKGERGFNLFHCPKNKILSCVINILNTGRVVTAIVDNFKIRWEMVKIMKEIERVTKND